MITMKLEIAQLNDADALADIFWKHINVHPEYISHGEMQMGVGVAGVTDNGGLYGVPAADGREKWMRYITEKMSSEDAAVYKAVSEGEIAGFCVADIEEDGDRPFGMVCDVLVKENHRGKGIGESLLEKAVGWLRMKGIKDIYLESGKDNASAHRFFEKRGFVHISEIFKLK